MIAHGGLDIPRELYWDAVELAEKLAGEAKARKKAGVGSLGTTPPGRPGWEKRRRKRG